MRFKIKFTPRIFMQWDKSKIYWRFLKIKLQTDLTSLMVS